MKLAALLDKASQTCGSDYALAKNLGVGRSKVSDWRNERASCGVEYRALMASIAGVDVDEVIRDALLEKHANTPLGERLLSALGNVVHGGAAITLTSLSAGYLLILALGDRCTELTMCITGAPI